MLRLAALALLLALAACSNRPGFALSQRADDAPRVRDAAYYDVLEDYTRYKSYYDGLDQRFFLAATWESWPFRQRKIAAVADFLSLPRDEVEVLLHRERVEATEFVDIFVGLYTAESRWDNLAEPDTIWRIELELPDGSTVLPAAVKKIQRPDANTKALYAYLNPFWSAYKVRFPALDQQGRPVVVPGSELKFRVTSAVGRATPTWAVAGDDLPR